MILIGPPGSGQESLAQALAQKLGLPLRHGLGEGAGVFYLSEPFPPKEVGLALKPLPGRVLVVARSSFGEDPSFLLALRTRFPAEVTVVEQVPCLSWREAVGGLYAICPSPRPPASTCEAAAGWRFCGNS